MGIKTFSTGAVLYAADVNTYLMNQSVMTFADATARSSAITSPTTGMVTFLSSTKSLYTYDGSAWIPNAPYAIQAWTASVTTTSASPWSTGTVAITNITRFSQKPIVVLGSDFSSSSQVVTQAAISGSANNWTITLRASVYAAAAATIPVQVVAVQMSTSSAAG